jgi:hypothetical protein
MTVIMCGQQIRKLAVLLYRIELSEQKHMTLGVLSFNAIY